MNMFKSRRGKTLEGLARELAEEKLANNRLMAVSGMSVEELTDAFIKGYRLVSPEAVKDDVHDDLRIVPKNTREQIPDMRVTAEEAAEAIQNLTKAGISQEDIESSDLPLYDPVRKRPESADAIEFSEKDAIKMLKSKMDGHTDTSYEWAETVRMSIKALEQEPCDDAISREDTLKAMIEQLGIKNEDYLIPAEKTLYKVVKNMPPITPQPKTGHCKDCKWWNDSDGMYRRGGHVESQCPINRREVFEGNGYCYMFEPQESER